MVRCDAATGEVAWQVPLDGLVTAMSATDTGLLVFALTSGKFAMADMRTGRILDERMLEADGLPTVGVSLSVRGNRVAVGTIDARLLLFRIAPTKAEESSAGE